MKRGYWVNVARENGIKADTYYMRKKLGYVPIKPYQTEVTYSKYFNNRGEFKNNDTEIYYVIVLKLERSNEHARV